LRALQLLYYYLGSLLLKILEENPVEQGQVNLNRTNRAHACDVVRTAVVARRPATIRRHAEVPLRPPVRAWCLGHCGNVRLTWSRVLGRCHAFRLHTLAGGAAPRHRAFVPPAHRLPGRRTCAMPRPMPDHVVVVTYARPPLHLTVGIKGHRCFLSRVPELPPPAIATPRRNLPWLTA
jgi:hypothetical protein